jgi:Predicted cobalamin binding protein
MDEIIGALEELNEDKVLEDVQSQRLSGTSNIEIMRALNSGMLLVGQRFEEGEYFLADLIVSGVIYRKALELLSTHQESNGNPAAGKVLIGVVKSDIHDIGKDIIISSLQAEGFEVIDLGTDVKAEEFVELSLRHRPDIIALSGTMGFAKDEIKKTILKLDEANVRSFAKIIVGGLCVTKQNSVVMGADGYSEDPIDVVNICQELLKND